MAMFRRRTDQVYATLQQVQRRITEEGGSGTPNLEAKQAQPPPFSPLHDALPRGQQKPLVAHQPEPPPLPSQMLAPQRRFVLPLSGQLAVTLIVLWIASCALCFVLGQHERDRRPAASPGEGYPAGDAGNREVATGAADSAPTKPLGNDLLILNQVLDATPEQERKFSEQAQTLNDIMLKNPQKGWKPWFGVRKPTNGGLQLVFGEVAEGQFGIVKKDYDEFARMMAQPPPKGGGYGKATWLKVE